jgi:hypothetical protein
MSASVVSALLLRAFLKLLTIVSSSVTFNYAKMDDFEDGFGLFSGHSCYPIGGDFNRFNYLGEVCILNLVVMLVPKFDTVYPMKGKNKSPSNSWG